MADLTNLVYFKGLESRSFSNLAILARETDPDLKQIGAGAAMFDFALTRLPDSHKDEKEGRKCLKAFDRRELCELAAEIDFDSELGSLVAVAAPEAMLMFNYLDRVILGAANIKSKLTPAITDNDDLTVKYIQATVSVNNLHEYIADMLSNFMVFDELGEFASKLAERWGLELPVAAE